MSSVPVREEPVPGAAGAACRVVVVGNEKGGSGKSTTAMHLVVHLLRRGYRVGCLDLDARQGTLSRYVRNRIAQIARHGLDLPVPISEKIERSDADSREAAEAQERALLDSVIGAMRARTDFLVVDTPGSDTFLTRGAIAHADTLVTPLNDSFVDLDVLAEVDPETIRVIRPSRYAETVWEQRKQRAMRGGRAIDWAVLRNRVGTLQTINNRAMEGALAELSGRIGFRVVPGFTERVIFRELFLKGLTLLDLRETGIDVRLSMSHVAARREIAQLAAALGLERPPAKAEAVGADPCESGRGGG